MKRLSLMLAGAIALAGNAAWAADLLKAPPAQSAYAYTWTGFYIGLHAGGAVSAVPLSSFNINPTGPLAGIGDPGVLGSGANGFVAGGNVGFNWQLASTWVAGLEVGVSATGLNSNTTSTPTTANILSATSANSIPWDGYVDAKLGFLVTPSLLFYGIGGLSFGEIKQNSSLQAALTNVNGAFDDVHTGWNAGAGLDYAVAPHLLIGARYRYVSYGKHGVTLQDPALMAAFDPSARAAFNEFTARLTIPLF